MIVHYDDIKKGIAAIKSLIESEDTNSKNVRTKALRADLEKAYSPDALKDLTSASLTASMRATYMASMMHVYERTSGTVLGTSMLFTARNMSPATLR